MKQKDISQAARKQAEIDRKKLENEIAGISCSIDRMKKAGSEDYIRYRTGELDEKAMRENAEKRKKDVEELLNRQKVLTGRLKGMDADTEKKIRYLRALIKCRKDTALSAEVLHALIDRIEIFPDKRIRVCFKYSGKEIGVRKDGDKA